MKDVRNLIDRHFYKNPLFKDINNARQCCELIKLMSLTHQNIIHFCYIRGNTLYFVLKHPLALQELKRDSSIFMIKELLKVFIKANPNSPFLDVCDIKFFVTNKLKFKNIYDPHNIKYEKAKPKSKAEFKNNAKDPKIYAKFEELRVILKDKNSAFK